MPTVAARARRDARIRALTAEGLSRRAVAKRVGLSAAGVQNVLASATVSRVLSGAALLEQDVLAPPIARPPASARPVEAPKRAERQGGLIDGAVIEPRPTWAAPLRYAVAAPEQVDLSATIQQLQAQCESDGVLDAGIRASQAETARCEAETAQIRADIADRKVASAERLRRRRLWDAADRLREGYVNFGVVLPPEALR